MSKTVKSLKSSPKNKKFNEERDIFIHSKKQNFSRTDKYSIFE
jgi:hypothetical protein